MSKVLGDNGDPWDLRFGLNWHPWHNHVVRWNYEYLHTDRSPVGGLSLPTLVGGTGGYLLHELPGQLLDFPSHSKR